MAGARENVTSRNKQETDGSQHSTTPPGAQKPLCGLTFRKACRILLRLRQKISSIEAKERKLWSFEEGQSIYSLESVSFASVCCVCWSPPAQARQAQAGSQRAMAASRQLGPAPASQGQPQPAASQAGPLPPGKVQPGTRKKQAVTKWRHKWLVASVGLF